MNFLLEVSSQKMPASNLASSQRCEDMWKAFMNGKWRKAQDKHAWSRSHVSAIRRNILSGRNSPLDISFILNLSCGEADSSVGFNLELKKKKKKDSHGQCGSVGWSIVRCSERPSVRFPIMAHATIGMVVGWIPSRGVRRKQLTDVSHIVVSFALSPFFSRSNENNINLKKRNN